MSVLTLRVSRVAAEAKDVLRVELVDAASRELPAFEPGAHLAVQLPGGLQRHYSLCGDWRERHRYVLGVGRAAGGRGGSDWMHGQLREGVELRCTGPVNNFRLADAPRYLFIAGGIGITPLLSMARCCAAQGKDWKMVYGVRTRQRLAFYEDLGAWRDRVQFHCDDEAGAPINVPVLLANLAPGTHVYCCGPAPLMMSVQQHAAHLPAGMLHFEWFSTPAEEPQAGAPPSGGFWIALRRSGGRYDVPPGRSILEVLEENGHEVPFSCREGLCGTCETPVCEGQPEHLDYVYPPSQRDSLRSLMVCVSRARSEGLVLDL
jgi:ferredoxin-NADP reductase